jgi:hypothetical protein
MPAEVLEQLGDHAGLAGTQPRLVDLDLRGQDALDRGVLQVILRRVQGLRRQVFEEKN